MRGEKMNKKREWGTERGRMGIKQCQNGRERERVGEREAEREREGKTRQTYKQRKDTQKRKPEEEKQMINLRVMRMVHANTLHY